MRRHYNGTPYMTTAKHSGWTCSETGAAIEKGDPMAYYPADKKAYSYNSKTAADVRALEFSAAFNMADSGY